VPIWKGKRTPMNPGRRTLCGRTPGGRTLCDRTPGGRTLAGALLVGVLVVTTVLTWSLPSRPDVGTFPVLTAAYATEPVAELDIHHFTLRVTNAAGDLQEVLEGTRLQRFVQLGVEHTEEPRLRLLSPDQGDWFWSAPQAVHYPRQQRLLLVGETHGEQKPGPTNLPMRIETADVTLLTDARQILTDAPLRLWRPDLQAEARGLHADLSLQRMDLLHDVITRHTGIMLPVEEGSP
jgi:lipopolysaccharide export system protein LptC